jgi:16S rRNA (adenine1518-N6/adenine1519-N6)-dimethyltransferase
MKMRPARKRFGQNFLHDDNIINKILTSLAPTANDHFLEIGPGRGAITRPLSELAGQLDVIEIDTDLADDLSKADWMGNVRIHRGDALQFPFDSLITNNEKLRMAGNLPYNISTPLLFHILDYAGLFQDIHVMLQKEVVQRMTAGPDNKSYGRLTVALAARCQVESLFFIRPGSFTPAPKVDSAFARLTPLPQPLISQREAPAFNAILRQAFGQRRKQLANSLRDLLSAEQIRAADIDPQQRAENLSVEQYVRLAKTISDSD